MNAKYLLLLTSLTFVLVSQSLTAQCAYGVVNINYFKSTGGAGTYTEPATGTIEYGFCFTLTGYFEKSTNWVHGIFVAWQDIPAGVHITQGFTGVQNTQHGSRTWIFVDSLKARQFNLPGLGYYVDDGDGNPSNNYGDNGNGTPNAEFPDLVPFCFEAVYHCGGPTLLRPVITVTGDGTTGAWKNPSCPGDIFKASIGGPNNDGIIIACGLVLPLELLSFEGYNNDGINYLTWTGIANAKFSYYSLEKKFDASGFFKVDSYFVPSNVKEYFAHTISCMDNPQDQEINYYRLKMVDNDNTFEYSKTIAIRNSNVKINQSTLVFPNPVDDLVHIQFSSHSKVDFYEIQILNLNGQVLIEQNIPMKGSNLKHFINVKSFSPGVYYLKLKSENESTEVFKLIKN